MKTVRALLPSAWASLALLQACAQVTGETADAGLPTGPVVSSIEPAPGAVAASASFRVTFSAPMDASLLLLQPKRSDCVVLVAEANVELVAAALNHGKLTSSLVALLVDTAAEVSKDESQITLKPKAPLAGGGYFVVVASRVKDAQGRRMPGEGARFGFTVARPPAEPRLDSPLAGWAAPLNLSRARVAFPDGPPDGPITLVERDGGIVAGPELSDGGPVLLDIRAARAGCGPLCPGAGYAVAVGGVQVEAATFQASSCTRSSELRWLAGGPALQAGDTWLHIAAELDWPALVHLDARPVGQSTARVASADVLVRCAPASCGSADGGSPCTLEGKLEELSAGASYLLTLSAEDDEGGRSAPLQLGFQTLGALAKAQISEVMASPPPPVPRSNGEYIEIFNAGSAPLDPARLAIAGPDDRVRPLSSAPSSPLAPGHRLLAVGAAFEPDRYTLPSDVVLLRADTQKLLGRGVADQPPAIRLLWLPESDGGSPIELDRFPGDGPNCAEGESLERDDSSDAGVTFRCGSLGGSPGSAAPPATPP